MEWEVFNDIRVDSPVNGHPLNNSGTIFFLMTLMMIMVIILLLSKKFS